MDEIHLGSQPNFTPEDAFKWLNSYHFLSLTQDKKLRNYSDEEIEFELEVWPFKNDFMV